MEKIKIGVIGCGPCGMAVVSAFNEAKNKGQAIPQLTFFEKQDKVSGLWNLTWRTGIDEYGEPVHGSMYRYLWSNGPKECLEMANYTFDEHFKKPIPSFPPRIVLQDYLLGRFEKCSQTGHSILFNTAVRNVAETDGKFKICYEDLKTKQCSDDTFDYVIVATGHFSFPNLPYYPGIETFNDKVLHSHDFRNAAEFKDQTVVLLGSSYSAEDIALQCVKYGAKKCIISYRTNKMGYNWPDNIIEVPQIEKIENKLVFCKDGSTHEADAIIFCTGYKHHYPFMEEKLRLKDATNIYCPKHLYKGVVYEDNPKLMYLGAQDQCYTYTLFDIQACFVRDIILGKIDIPDRETMVKSIAGWYKRCMTITSPAEAINYQRDYLEDLLTDTDYCSKESNSKIAEMLNTWVGYKKENILTYRDKCFASPYTGAMAIPLTKDWFYCLDDSKESFLRGCQ